MTAAKLGAIAGILFDKDGTLLDYDQSWLPVNRELARIAAQDDPILADHLLSACGMDPITGHIVPDSLLAAGNTRQISEGLVAAGSKVSVAELVEKLDALFAHAADFSSPVTDLAAFFQQEAPVRPCLLQFSDQRVLGLLVGDRHEIGWPLTAHLEMLDLAKVAPKLRRHLAGGTLNDGQQA